MGNIRLDSRRQKIINLGIGELLRFPVATRSKVVAQLSEIKASTGYKYKVSTEDKEFTVTRIA